MARLLCLSGLATGFIMLFDMLVRGSRGISGSVLIIAGLLNTAAVPASVFCGGWCALSSQLANP